MTETKSTLVEKITSTEETGQSLWPMRADHITSDGKLIGLEGCGIITNQELQGHQSELSHEIGHATTIIEFSLKGDPIRTDSPFIDLAMHPSCYLFRANNPVTDAEGNILIDDKTQRPIPGSLCRFCDQCHAKLFYGCEESTLLPQIIKLKKEGSTKLKNLYALSIDSLFEPRIYKNRLFLEYDCPILGFRELVFPILFEKQVIAVFFLGQLTLESRKKTIFKMIKNIQLRFPDCFKHSTNHNIVEEIINAQKDWIEGKKTKGPQMFASVISEEMYRNTISSIIDAIKNLENRLTHAFSHMRHEYIRKSILTSSQMTDFTKTTEIKTIKNKAEILDDQTLQKLWHEFEGSLSELVKSFSLKYALVFGPSKILDTQQDYIYVQAKSGSFEGELADNKFKELRINLETV